jgi:small subunit ribosomal protein S17
MRNKKGIVTSASMTGTVTVTVHRSMFHPIYKKRYKLSKKFLADSNGQTLHNGDEVVITECRPISKRKHFKVTEVLKKSDQVSELKEEQEVQEAASGKRQAASNDEEANRSPLLAKSSSENSQSSEQIDTSSISEK